MLEIQMRPHEHLLFLFGTSESLCGDSSAQSSLSLCARGDVRTPGSRLKQGCHLSPTLGLHPPEIERARLSALGRGCLGEAFVPGETGSSGRWQQVALAFLCLQEG